MAIYLVLLRRTRDSLLRTFNMLIAVFITPLVASFNCYFN